MITFLNIAIPSFGAGILVATVFAMYVGRDRKDHFTQAAEAEVYGDVPFLGAVSPIEPSDVHHTGFRNQFQR